MQKKIRVGFVCREYPPCNHGGVGTFYKDLTEGLISRGHYAIVFGIYSKNVLDLSEAKEEIVNGVKVYRYPEKHTILGPYFDDIYKRFQYRRITNHLIRKHCLDLIESNESTGHLPFPIKKDLVTRLHGSVTYISREINRPFSRFISYFERQQLKRSKLIIGVSQYTLRKTLEYFRLHSQYTMTIYNSISDAFYSEKKPISVKRITYFGQVSKKKGVWALFEAMDKVFDKHPDFELHVIGKYADSCKVELLSLINHKYHNKVTFFTHLSREDLREKILDSYCCVFPSFVECFSLSPMEAMALGVPVVYSTLHSGPELIQDGINGLLINPNKVHEISEKINYLIENPGIAYKIGLTGQESIKKRFNYSKWLDENIQVYENLLMK